MLVLIIHLESAAHRKANVARLLAQFADQDARILPAVRGAALSEGAKAQWRATRPINPAYPFALNDGEIGCFLSHRTAWRTLLDSGHDSALILEDDAVVDREKLDQTLSQIHDQEDPPDYVQLQTRPLKSGRTGLVIERPLPLRTTGQWLTSKAAEHLLPLSATLDRPIDAFLQLTWHHKIPITTAYPSGISEADETTAKTTIQKTKTKNLWSKLRKSIKRSTYRRKVREMSASAQGTTHA